MMTIEYIVELEHNVFLAEGEGDPPRTMLASNAAGFQFKNQADNALVEAREFRPFKDARVVRRRS